MCQTTWNVAEKIPDNKQQKPALTNLKCIIGTSTLSENWKKGWESHWEKEQGPSRMSREINRWGHSMTSVPGGYLLCCSQPQVVEDNQPVGDWQHLSHQSAQFANSLCEFNFSRVTKLGRVFPSTCQACRGKPAFLVLQLPLVEPCSPSQLT